MFAKFGGRLEDELSPDQFNKLKADASSKYVGNAGGALYTLLGVAPSHLDVESRWDMSHGCQDSPCFCYEHLYREEHGANNKRNLTS